MNSQTEFTSCDVLVLGGGYSGLMAALRVKGRLGPSFSVGLVNPYPQFVERIRLQDTLAPAVKLKPVSLECLLQHRDITFYQGVVRFIDAQRCVVEIRHLEREFEIGYDRMVYALGSHTERSSVPGTEEFANFLDSESATESIKNQLAQRQDGKIAVVGGGALGIEVAAELKTSHPCFDVALISQSYIGRFQTTKVKRILRSGLKDLGVVLHDQERVTEVAAAELIVSQKGVAERPIAYDICIWCAGMSSARIAGLSSNRTATDGRYLVNEYMQIEPNIWVVGDAARPTHFTGAPYRLSAMAALASGAYCGDSIANTLNNRDVIPFSFSTWGQGIALGAGGVGFLSYPNDRQCFIVFHGKTARALRDFFAWMLLKLLTLESRVTGAFFWLGKSRAAKHTRTAA